MKPEDFKFKSLYKKAIVRDIKTLRKEGASFKEIAQLYNDLDGYSTLSGIGVWHAQSVHRLVQT